MWNVGSPPRPQEMPANPYLQGLSALSVKVKAIFLKPKINHEEMGGAVLYDPTGTYHLIQLKKAMIVGSNYLLDAGPTCIWLA